MSPSARPDFHNKYSCGTATGDKIASLGIKLWYGKSKNTLVGRGHHSNAIWADQGSIMLPADLNNFLLNVGCSSYTFSSLNPADTIMKARVSFGLRQLSYH